MLRATGIRVEELPELTHHSLVQYRLPATGELVPLLQIAPSKTDAERLLVVSPDLADVLAAIISRLRGPAGAVPLVRRLRPPRAPLAPPAPLLFQRRAAAPRTGPSPAAPSATCSTPPSPAPASPTRHRRSRCASPRTTSGGCSSPTPSSTACPRTSPRSSPGTATSTSPWATKPSTPTRPSEPTWPSSPAAAPCGPARNTGPPPTRNGNEFLGHFERRKVSTGTCGRAFGTPCIHEHACIRCPMLWPDPAQRTALAEIRDNLTARIAEAEREGWLGEVEGLKISLAGADDKLAQIDRRTRGQPVNLGIPAAPQPA